MKFTTQQEKFIKDNINETIKSYADKVKKPYLKLITGLGVVILLETGALIWSLAIGVNENNHQDESIKELSETVTQSIKSNNTLIIELTNSTIKNAEKSQANKNRLDRSPY